MAKAYVAIWPCWQPVIKLLTYSDQSGALIFQARGVASVDDVSWLSSIGVKKPNQPVVLVK